MTKKNFIRDARRELGLSQTEFGERIGKSRRSIIDYEQGTTEPPRSVVIAVKALLERSKS